VFYGQGPGEGLKGMNLTDLAETLPNGFHDAQLHRYQMDFAAERLVIELDVWVGDMEDRARREAYRPARLTLGAVRSFVMEPPASEDPWLDRGSVTIDTGVGERWEGSGSLPATPPGFFRAHFFIQELNTFFHALAENASLEWLGDEYSWGTRCRGTSR
jgi:hypothetical protein